MVLNADSIEVLNFLKSIPGQFVALRAIARQAGGRRRFEESPGWANGLMRPLVDAGLIEINDRGHYRYKDKESTKQASTPSKAHPPIKKYQTGIVGDYYFPAPECSVVIGENYFPRESYTEEANDQEEKAKG